MINHSVNCRGCVAAPKSIGFRQGGLASEQDVVNHLLTCRRTNPTSPVAVSPLPDRLALPRRPKKRRRMADKMLSWKVRELVPESQAYMDLLAFERKLDATIMRKRLDIQVSCRRT